jgi:hypothetical protein
MCLLTVGQKVALETARLCVKLVVISLLANRSNKKGKMMVDS